ncbi:MAG: nucleotidyltransferase family protein [Parcubacteria group bacterium]|nr:nucleotidyltransferase family protein [Parcubacteria group bacterium]
MTIEEIKQKALPILEKYGVEYAAVFGSVARGQQQIDSDVDLLVRVEHIPFGIWGFVGLKQDLEKALGVKVDIVSEQGIDPRFASKIQTDLVKLYERL